MQKALHNARGVFHLECLCIALFIAPQIAWAVGSVMEALLALVVMTSIDHEPWRWLLGLSAVPLLVVILVFPVSILNCGTVTPRIIQACSIINNSV